MVSIALVQGHKQGNARYEHEKRDEEVAVGDDAFSDLPEVHVQGRSFAKT
jgi:hypothetical protein